VDDGKMAEQATAKSVIGLGKSVDGSEPLLIKEVKRIGK